MSQFFLSLPLYICLGLFFGSRSLVYLPDPPRDSLFRKWIWSRGGAGAGLLATAALVFFGDHQEGGLLLAGPILYGFVLVGVLAGEWSGLSIAEKRSPAGRGGQRIRDYVSRWQLTMLCFLAVIFFVQTSSPVTTANLCPEAAEVSGQLTAPSFSMALTAFLLAMGTILGAVTLRQIAVRISPRQPSVMIDWQRCTSFRAILNAWGALASSCSISHALAGNTAVMGYCPEGWQWNAPAGWISFFNAGAACIVLTYFVYKLARPPRLDDALNTVPEEDFR